MATLSADCLASTFSGLTVAVLGSARPRRRLVHFIAGSRLLLTASDACASHSDLYELVTERASL